MIVRSTSSFTAYLASFRCTTITNVILSRLQSNLNYNFFSISSIKLCETLLFFIPMLLNLVFACMSIFLTAICMTFWTFMITFMYIFTLMRFPLMFYLVLFYKSCTLLFLNILNIIRIVETSIFKLPFCNFLFIINLTYSWLFTFINTLMNIIAYMKIMLKSMN